MTIMHTLEDAQKFLADAKVIEKMPQPLQSAVSRDLKAIKKCNQILENPFSSKLDKEIALSDLGYYENELSNDYVLARSVVNA